MSEKPTLPYPSGYLFFKNFANEFSSFFRANGAAKKLFVLVVFVVSVISGVSACTTPVVNLGPDVTQCGGTVLLDAGNAGATYLWSDNSTGEFLQVSVTNTYKVTVTNAPNCSASASINVTINPVPAINLGGNITQCGGSVRLDGGTGSAGILVDQSQTNVGVGLPFAQFDQKDLAQSFIPELGSISGASIFLGSLGHGGNVTISLYTGLPNAGGTLLTSGTENNVVPGDTVVVSWPSVFVIPGNTYYLVFTSTDSLLSLGGSLANPYPDGIAYADVGYQPFPGDDFAFQTFSSTSYNWSDGSGNRQLTVSTSGDYTVTVSNAYNCSASASVNVYIKPVPVVDLGPNVTQCGGSVTLDAGNPGSTYHWFNSSTGETFNVTTTGTYNVTVTDTASGCSAYGVVNVAINPVLVVSLGPDIAQCNPSAVLNAGNAGATYQWTGGTTAQMLTVTNSGYYQVTVTSSSNCTASSGVNVLFYPRPDLGPDKTIQICPFSTTDLTTLYVTQGLNVTYSTAKPGEAGPGTYTIIASNQNGCSDTASVTVTNYTPPNLGPDLADSICPSTTADLTSYFNTTGLTVNYGVVFPHKVGPGVYPVIATNQNGCSDTAAVTITYRQKPNLGPDLTDSICIGYTYDLTALYPNNGYAAYAWNSTGPPNAVAAGVYTLIVSNNSGCTDTAVATILNRIQPVAGLTLPHDICITVAPFTLTGGTPAGGTYFIDTAITTFDPVGEGIGTHHVTYVFTNASGCSDSAGADIVVHKQPFITTLLAPDICTTSVPIDLDNYFTPTGGVYNGLGVSTHFFYPVITPSGQDTIVDIYTDNFGCMDTSVYPVTVHQAVHTQMTTSVAEYSICENQSVTFYATGAEQYQFLINGQSQGPASSTDTFSTTALQNHDEITVVGSNPCSSDTAGPVIYDVHSLPVVNAGSDTSIALGTSIQLQGSATGSGLLLFQWYPSKGLNYTTITNPVYSGSDSITFTLYAEDIYGCLDSALVSIGVYIPDAIVLPNIITPDGDGKNDVWKINPKLDLTGSSLVIFDRWGEKVYETENYASNWGGTYRNTGKPLPDGTYYYVFKVPSEQGHVYRGAISIVNGGADR